MLGTGQLATGPTLHPKRKWRDERSWKKSHHADNSEDGAAGALGAAAGSPLKRHAEPLLIVCCARSTSGEPLTQTFVALPQPKSPAPSSSSSALAANGSLIQAEQQLQQQFNSNLALTGEKTAVDDDRHSDPGDVAGAENNNAVAAAASSKSTDGDSNSKRKVKDDDVAKDEDDDNPVSSSTENSNGNDDDDDDKSLQRRQRQETQQEPEAEEPAAASQSPQPLIDPRQETKSASNSSSNNRRENVAGRNGRRAAGKKNGGNRRGNSRSTERSSNKEDNDDDDEDEEDEEEEDSGCCSPVVSGEDDIYKFIVGPHYLLGEKRFYYFVPLLAAVDALFCILGCFGVEPILNSPSAALAAPEFFAIVAYVAIADVVAVAACSKPSLVKTTISLVILVPKLFFGLLDASSFFAVSVWLTIVVVILVATARSGISWNIVDIPQRDEDDEDEEDEEAGDEDNDD